MNFKRLITVTSFLGLAACGTTESRTVSGQLSSSARASGASEVVATSAKGLEVVGAVGDDGRFSLELPLGSYSVAFRAPQASGRTVHFAHLVGRGAGAPRGVMRVEAGDDDLDLGAVVRSDDPAAHDANDDNGVDDPATHDIGDDNGVDDPATHDIGDDHGQDCRNVDPSTGGMVSTVSFLVVPSSELPFDDNPTSGGGALDDSDDDGRADRHDDDDDSDGICDDDDSSDDSDSDGGVDDGDSGSDDDSDGRADLPYHVDPALGARFALADAFAEKGAQPAEILSLEMPETEWRLAELRAGTPFEVTQADCDHEGNSGRGRDRIYISWRNADGSVELDHFEIRYCD